MVPPGLAELEQLHVESAQSTSVYTATPTRVQASGVFSLLESYMWSWNSEHNRHQLTLSNSHLQ